MPLSRAQQLRHEEKCWGNCKQKPELEFDTMVNKTNKYALYIN